jgi:aspartyl-tRNA(Asn)/glutamyl-tRNA(Gln) amidotransferase subunit A
MSLEGWTIPVKDNIDVAGRPTRAGSRATSPHPVAQDADVVRRLRDAGATIGAKTSMDEFACTTLGPGLVNPHDRSRTTGGSSSGSAVAVATRSCRVALGTDTGGSVRIPASYCGVVGFKPSHDEIPTVGVVPLSPTLDHVGLIGDRVSSVEHVFAHCRTSDPSPGRHLADLRVGIPDATYLSAALPEVLAAWTEAVALLSDLGAAISTVRLPEPERLLPVHLDIAAVEAAAYHLHHFPSLSRHGDGILSVIERGCSLDGDAYRSALAQRQACVTEVEQCFLTVDIVVTPTTPTTSPQLGSSKVQLATGEEVSRLEASIWYTALFNDVGAPAISLPAAPAGRLPVGVQLAAGKAHDDVLLGTAAALEEALPPLPDRRERP